MSNFPIKVNYFFECEENKMELTRYYPSLIDATYHIQKKEQFWGDLVKVEIHFN